jgi:hypothetical protein
VIPRHFQITLGLLLLAILVSGIYLVRLKRREEALNLESTPTHPVAPIATGKQERIRVLLAYDEDQALRWRDAEVLLPTERTARAKEVLRAVLAQYLQSPSPHTVGKGADIKEVYLVSNDTLIVDATAPFADGHPPGILLEELTLTSLIETLTANVPGIARVKFLVDGQERETLAGHLDLMPFYETSAVHELVKEFE